MSKMVDIPKCAGIYRIVNLSNGHCYIGQSKDLHSRAKAHFNALDNNRHINAHLQSAYNKYGKGTFVFDVLESPIKYIHLDDKEQYYIELLHPQYNIIRNVFEGIGCALNDKITRDNDCQPVYDESIKPLGWADEHRPKWHRLVYGGG